MALVLVFSLIGGVIVLVDQREGGLSEWVMVGGDVANLLCADIKLV